MSDAELGFRNQDDYVSKYRRVLEYFAAVKVGLTATPALHTVDIFGSPVFTYSYREAVIDDFLIDHDPPLQITTALSQAGITFKKGEKVELIDTKTGAIDLAHLPDDIQFEVENFNKKVVTVAFNRTVADELARLCEIMPARGIALILHRRPSMTPLRQRMIEDMQLRHLSPHTQRAYLTHVARFAQLFHRSPDLLGPPEIRSYQLHLTRDRQFSPNSIGVANAALRFLYKVTLKRE